MPVLQGLQGRLPGARGHGDLQGGVSLALLQTPDSPPARLRLRIHPFLGAPGEHCAARRELLFAASAFQRSEQMAHWDCKRKKDSCVCNPNEPFAQTAEKRMLRKEVRE